MIKTRLKALIATDKSLSQKTIAADVGVSPSYLSKVLASNRGGDFDLLSRIATAAGTSIQELLDEETPDLSYNAPEPYGQPATNENNVYDLEHAELVKNFQNKELAMHIDQQLLALEQIDAERLELIEKYISLQLTEAKIHNRAGSEAPQKRQPEPDSLKKKSA